MWAIPRQGTKEQPREAHRLEGLREQRGQARATHRRDTPPRNPPAARQGEGHRDRGDAPERKGARRPRPSEWHARARRPRMGNPARQNGGYDVGRRRRAADRGLRERNAGDRASPAQRPSVSAAANRAGRGVPALAALLPSRSMVAQPPYLARYLRLRHGRRAPGYRLRERSRSPARAARTASPADRHGGARDRGTAPRAAIAPASRSAASGYAGALSDRPPYC